MSAEVPMAVPGTLRRWISDITVLTASPPGQRPPLVHVPDAATSLVVRAAPGQRGDLIVAGPRTHASYYPGKDFPLCLKVRLRPGAARLLLRIPASQLVDQVVSFAEIGDTSDPQPSDLAGTAADPQLILKHLEKVLLTRITARTTADLARSELVRAAAGDLAVRPGGVPLPVRSIARQLAISERHLRNLFSECIGLPPKRFQRITRVRRVLADGRSGNSRWAHLAITAGYYDQSHMTAEFRSMMGVPPAAFFAGYLPPLQPC
jgi:AraC-like DNA-binding protein